MVTIDPKILGKRLKFFRERAHISQFDLENKIEGANGMISRIENGKVNPCKETVLGIAEVLGLNNCELDYLIGITASPATEKEIEKARQEAEKFMKTKTCSYLIDERWRLCGITDSFLKVINVDRDYANKMIGRSTIEFLTNPELKLLHLFSPQYLEKMYDCNLKYFYKEVGFMNDDEYYQRAVDSINKNKLSAKVWDKVTTLSKDDIDYSLREGRVVYFRVANKFDIGFKYLYENLLVSSRFKVVEYVPENRFVKFLSKLL